MQNNYQANVYLLVVLKNLAETSTSSFSGTERVTVNHTHMGQSVIRHGVSSSSNMYTPTMSTSATESTHISSCVQTTTVIHGNDY